MKIKSLVALALGAAALIVSGCYLERDPYEGLQGVRANINGVKYVHRSTSVSSAMYNTSTDGEGQTLYTLRSSSAMKNNLESYDTFKDLDFYLEDSAPFSAGKVFSIGEKSKASWAAKSLSGSLTIVKFVTDPASSDGTPFLEATFILDGVGSDGKPIAIRHGFLRLPLKITTN